MIYQRWLNSWVAFISWSSATHPGPPGGQAAFLLRAATRGRPSDRQSFEARLREVFDRPSELLGQQGVQERIDGTVQVEEEECNRRSQKCPEGQGHAWPILPHYQDVVGQHAHGEADDDADQEAYDFPSGHKRISALMPSSAVMGRLLRRIIPVRHRAVILGAHPPLRPTVLFGIITRYTWSPNCIGRRVIAYGCLDNGFSVFDCRGVAIIYRGGNLGLGDAGLGAPVVHPAAGTASRRQRWVVGHHPSSAHPWAAPPQHHRDLRIYDAHDYQRHQIEAHAVDYAVHLHVEVHHGRFEAVRDRGVLRRLKCVIRD